jgi:hypothetical protein
MKGAAAGEQLNAGMQMIGQGLSAAGTIAASGYGGRVKNSPDSLSANASFDSTIGSPYGNFDKAYSPKINYSQYWKPSK